MSSGNGRACGNRSNSILAMHAIIHSTIIPSPRISSNNMLQLLLLMLLLLILPSTLLFRISPPDSSLSTKLCVVKRVVLNCQSNKLPSIDLPVPRVAISRKTASSSMHGSKKTKKKKLTCCLHPDSSSSSVAGPSTVDSSIFHQPPNPSSPETQFPTPIWPDASAERQKREGRQELYRFPLEVVDQSLSLSLSLSLSPGFAQKFSPCVSWRTSWSSGNTRFLFASGLFLSSSSSASPCPPPPPLSSCSSLTWLCF